MSPAEGLPPASGAAPSWRTPSTGSVSYTSTIASRRPPPSPPRTLTSPFRTRQWPTRRPRRRRHRRRRNRLVEKGINTITYIAWAYVKPLRKLSIKYGTKSGLAFTLLTSLDLNYLSLKLYLRNTEIIRKCIKKNLLNLYFKTFFIHRRAERGL